MNSLFDQKRILAASLMLTLVACATPPKPQPVEPRPVTPPVVTTVPPTTPPTLAPKLAPITNYTQAYKLSSYAELPGWGNDDLREAWPAFLNSCSALKNKSEWKEVCSKLKNVDAKDSASIRGFFEMHFLPYQVQHLDGALDGMVTGYYEPLLKGSRTRNGVFQTALYAAPSDLLTIDLGSVYPDLKNMRLRGRLVGNKVVPYASRAEILPFLAGKELVWVDDPIDAFFLQIQGSGRVQLNETGEVVRVAYADQNGHPYKSIGRYLVDKGELTLDQASAQGIKAWIAKNLARQEELLNANPSVVFFKEEKLLDPSIGPKGALGVPLVPQRSIAVDPTQLPLGAPVFLSTTMPLSSNPLQRLMMAQDTGGAIRGAVRADFFWGFGREPGELAGRMKQRGSMWLLLPKTFETKNN
ncbi:murein transglycosylase A [Undibacterium seohonense]|nr:murein transglycosylase A [Undibacterium seohonense]